MGVEKRSVPTETQECYAFVEWCRKHAVPVAHFINEGKRGFVQVYHLHKMGMAKGIPDYFIPVCRKGLGGVFIEMKRNMRYTPSAMAKWGDQLAWIELLQNNGYKAQMCFGARDAIVLLADYLYG